MSAPCLEGASTVAPTFPIEGSRPTDLALLGDALILLALIAALYFGFKRISRHPAIPTSIALAIVFYAAVDRLWWNTASVVVDEVGVRFVPWMGDEVTLAWAEVSGFSCRGGGLFPIITDDARIVVHGPENISKIEIPRFLDRFPDLARAVADKTVPLVTP